MHIHVIERGLAVVFMQKQDQIHALDPWDTKFNQRIEEQESKRIANNPLARFRYERFSTFAGYLYFSEMTPKQEDKYLEIKHRKRAKRFKENEEQEKVVKFEDFVYMKLTEGKLTKEALDQLCIFQGKQIKNVENILNQRLRQSQFGSHVSQLYKKMIAVKDKKNTKPEEIEELVPEF